MAKYKELAACTGRRHVLDRCFRQIYNIIFKFVTWIFQLLSYFAFWKFLKIRRYATVINNIVHLKNVTVEGANIANIDLTSLRPTLNSENSLEPVKTSINNVKSASTTFVETQEYKECLAKARAHTLAILHLHGYPGTGKSEIVMKIAEEFPWLNDTSISVKYHIECGNKGHNLETELVNLMEEMKENNLITNADHRTRRAESALKKYRTKPYVEILRDCDVPILIIIEDPKDETTQLLSQLLLSLNELQNVSKPLHVHITTRRNYTAMPRDNLSRLSIYNDHEVEGFTEGEALEFVFGANIAPEEERQAVLKLYGRLSGSPLGFIAVKATCRKSMISYSKYLENVNQKDLEQITHSREDKHLREEYGNHVTHLFQAITLLLMPSEDADTTGQIIWKVMTHLAFLHHGEIPRHFIARLTELSRSDIRSTSVISSQNEAQSGEFISNLRDYDICKLSESDNADFRKQTVTFHEVVLHAVRVKINTSSPETSYDLTLKETVFTLSGIVNKDLRKTQDNIYMNKLSPHIQSVLKYAEENLSLRENVRFTKEDFILQMSLVHLYEVLGIVLSLGIFTLKNESERCLKKATDLILETVNALTESPLDLSILDPKSNQGLLETNAREVVKHCHAAGKALYKNFPSETIDVYMSKVLQIKEIEFLEERSGVENAMMEVKDRIGKSLGLDTEVVAKLRTCRRIFLDRPSHCNMFFSERLASILHTWGRVILYYHIPITPEIRNHFKWFSRLSNAISVECRKQVKIKTLFEQLSSISIVPIMLKDLEKTEEGNDVLREAKSILQNTLDTVCKGNQDMDIYEHGHIKETGAVYDKIILRRYMVRINAKLVKSASPNDSFFEDADEVCETLYQFSMEHSDWIMSPKCIVYCGKYYAAKQNYSRASDCFHQALELGIDQSMNLYAWACYNYSRATVSGKVKQHLKSATKRCRNLLENPKNIDEDLIKKVTEQYKLLLQLNQSEKFSTFLKLFILGLIAAMLLPFLYSLVL